MAKDAKSPLQADKSRKSDKAAPLRLLLLHRTEPEPVWHPEPEKYGSTTRRNSSSILVKRAERPVLSSIACNRNFSEGVLPDRIHASRTDGTCACIINAGAFTHPVGVAGCLCRGASLPFIEVHITKTCMRGRNSPSLLSERHCHAHHRRNGGRTSPARLWITEYRQLLTWAVAVNLPKRPPGSGIDPLPTR